MCAAHFSNHRLRADVSGSVSSHLLTLQCVLDKYQHENKLLTHNIGLLLEENKKLWQHSHNNHFHIPRVLDHHTYRNFNQVKNNIMQNNTTVLYPSGYYQNNHIMKTKNIKITPNSPNSISLSKSICELLSEDESKTQRKREFSKSQYEKSVRREQYCNEGISVDYGVGSRIENDYDNKTQRKGKQRTKTQQNLSPRKFIRVKKFTKEVYLEAETFYDEPSSERLPTFGYEENRDKFMFEEKCFKQKVQYEQIKENKVKKQKENIEKGYIVQKMSHQQKQQILRHKQKFIQQKRVQDKQESYLSQPNNLQIQIINGKKTNQPYKHTDFKLAEPKAVFAKVSQGREDSHQQKREKSVVSTDKKNRSIVNKMAKLTVLR